MGFYETADYRVIDKHGNIEVREYEAFLIASTNLEMNQKQSSGFNNVFNYISGQNSRREKISMTIPVVTTIENEYLITSFVVPQKYHGNIPEPSSKDVFIEKVEKGKFIAIRFNGSWTPENYDKHDETLLEYIKSNNIEVASKRYIFRYQGPFIPGIFRRNEIVYRIESK